MTVLDNSSVGLVVHIHVSIETGSLMLFRVIAYWNLDQIMEIFNVVLSLPLLGQNIVLANHLNRQLPS